MKAKTSKRGRRAPGFTNLENKISQLAHGVVRNVLREKGNETPNGIRLGKTLLLWYDNFNSKVVKINLAIQESVAWRNGERQHYRH